MVVVVVVSAFADGDGPNIVAAARATMSTRMMRLRGFFMRRTVRNGTGRGQARLSRRAARTQETTKSPGVTARGISTGALGGT